MQCIQIEKSDFDRKQILSKNLMFFFFFIFQVGGACGVCGKPHLSRTGLLCHMKTHDSFCYKCTRFIFSFPRKSSVKRHPQNSCRRYFYHFNLLLLIVQEKQKAFTTRELNCIIVNCSCVERAHLLVNSYNRVIKKPYFTQILQKLLNRFASKLSLTDAKVITQCPCLKILRRTSLS